MSIEVYTRRDGQTYTGDEETFYCVCVCVYFEFRVGNPCRTKDDRIPFFFFFFFFYNLLFICHVQSRTDSVFDQTHYVEPVLSRSYNNISQPRSYASRDTVKYICFFLLGEKIHFKTMNLIFIMPPFFVCACKFQEEKNNAFWFFFFFLKTYYVCRNSYAITRFSSIFFYVSNEKFYRKEFFDLYNISFSRSKFFFYTSSRLSIFCIRKTA